MALEFRDFGVARAAFGGLAQRKHHARHPWKPVSDAILLLKGLVENT